MDVFISWTTADIDIKNAIAERLNQLNISYYDSDEYCTSDFSEECIAEVKKCKVFIVIISDDSMARGYVKNEVVTARACEDLGTLNILVYKVTDKPYNNRFEGYLNHISFTTGNLVNRNENTHGESGIDRIIKRTVRLLEMRRNDQPDKPYDVDTPIVSGLQLTDTGYFVNGSRSATFEAIDNAFKRSNIIILKEMFGYGKRSTVKKYLELQGNRYKYKVMPENSGDLYDFFLSGLKFSNVNPAAFNELEGTALINRKFDFLDKLPDSTVLIIPDLTFEALPDRTVCERLAALKCKVILLTQGQAEQYVDLFPVIDLGRLEDKYLSELFFHHYKYADENEREALKAPLEAFFENIGGHTKTVELTAIALARDFGAHPEEIPQYLELHGNDGAKLQDRIFNQLDSLFDLETLTEAERKVLLVAAYLATPPISEKSFSEVLSNCGVTNREAVMSLSRRRWIDVDMMNRSVSIEPIIAQIVLNKSERNYVLLAHCFEHVSSRLVSQAFFQGVESMGVSGYGKLERLLLDTGFTLEAKICGLIKQYAISGDAGFDRAALKEAVKEYKSLHNEDYEVYVDDEYTDAEGIDIEDCECTDDIDETEAILHEDEAFAALVEYFMSVSVLPATIIASDISKFAADFSANPEICDRMTDGVDLEAALGISFEELQSYVEFMQHEFETSDEFDEDNAVSTVTAESLAFVCDYMKRNRHTLLEHLSNILECIDEFPEALEHSECRMSVVLAFSVAATGFVNAGAAHSAVDLIENLFKKAPDIYSEPMILTNYTAALENAKIYNDVLFEAYDVLLNTLKETRDTAYDSVLQAKTTQKSWVLSYSRSLMMGGRIDEAVRKFKEAVNVSPESYIEDTVELAEKLVDEMINSGNFEDAIDFISENFPQKVMKQYAESGDEETLKILDNFIVFLDSVKQDDDDSQDEAYTDYYSGFSRQNNPFLERRYRDIADKAIAYDFSNLLDEDIAEYAKMLKSKAKNINPKTLMPEAFALVSEAGKRALGFKHHYVQYMGAAAMADGKIAEILNGEGKTYTIVLVAFYHYICGRQAVILDSSEFLTERNCRWMDGVYKLLGVTTRSFVNSRLFREIVVKDKPDVIYAHLQNFVFGYLNNELSLFDERYAIDEVAAIIDEADYALVDEALDCLGIAAVDEEATTDTVELHNNVYNFVSGLESIEKHYHFEKGRVVFETTIYRLIEKYFDVRYIDAADIPLIKEIESLIRSCIVCCCSYVKNSNYYIVNDQPMFEDRGKGIYKKFNVDYDYFIRRKESLPTSDVELSMKRTRQYNLICLSDFLKKFYSLTGTTATAISFAKEFKNIYGLEYVAIPTNKPCIRINQEVPIFASLKLKHDCIVQLIKDAHATGQPILVVTQSVDESRLISDLLTKENIQHNLVNADNPNKLSDIIASSGKPYSILVGTSLVNRGVDIKLGGDPELQTRRDLVNLGVDVTALDSFVNTKATPEQTETELYKKYYSILEKNKILAEQERQKVLEVGGLCVIGTSFFGEKRTEQQTLGRSGRQGDRGECYLFRSTEDEDMKLFLNDRFLDMVERMNVTDFPYKMLKRSLISAQRAFHNANFRKIYNANNLSHYVDLGRDSFIGKKYAILENRLNSHDLLKLWAEDKSTLSAIEQFLKGEDLTQQHPLLKMITELRGDALRNAPKRRLSRVLLTLVCETIIDEESDIKSLAFDHILMQELLDGFEDYIKVCEELSDTPASNDRANRELLESEISRLVMLAIENSGVKMKSVKSQLS